MRRGGGQQEYLAATRLAKLGACEIQMLLDEQHGEVVTAARRRARDRGDEEHRRFDRVVQEAHNQRPTGRKGPCFVATAVYGPADPRTDELRGFRDEVLKPSQLGRWFVAWYYRHSPRVARLLGKHRWLARIAGRILDGTRWVLVTRRFANDRDGDA